MDETKPEPQAQISQHLLDELDNLLADRARRDKRTESSYANNVGYEPSVWDLKLAFGTLLQRRGQNEIDWHTAITVPWAQAKLMEYFLRLNLAIHERNHGLIRVPKAMVPPTPNPPTEEQIKEDPDSQEFFDLFKKIHKEVFG